MKNAVFTLAVLALMATPALAQPAVVCESDGSFRECRLEGVGVGTLVRQMSDAACIEGQTWGYRDGRIWVDKGCRASFALTNRVGSAPLDTRVVCESRDNGLTRCAANTAAGVQIARRISDSGCEFGRDWGYDRDGIWVTNGCRAEFSVSSSRIVAVPSVPATSLATQTLLCESNRDARNHCRADTSMGVLLTRQISDSPCSLNRTWGFDDDGVWVTAGCRAEFTTVDARFRGTMVSSVGRTAPTLVCESENNGHKHCRADTRFGVTMLRQISDTRCERNRTWGVDDVGVWVTGGCRAEFVLERR
ncbi:MAG TPA: DUF3011 domain-containing protein [Thermoanaerobaculia bacterium]